MDPHIIRGKGTTSVPNTASLFTTADRKGALFRLWFWFGLRLPSKDAYSTHFVKSSGLNAKAKFHGTRRRGYPFGLMAIQIGHCMWPLGHRFLVQILRAFMI